MKSYLFDHIIRKVKKYSENLEVKNILCEKPWIVFNDTGEKEVFIFRNDGTVLVTKNGEGVKTTWEWIPTNKSLLINKVEQENSIVILRPEFVNNTVLALQLDGTEKYTFLIDENNQEKFLPKTLTELKQYFIALESLAIEAEKQKLIDKANKEAEEKLADERRKAQEIEDEKIDKENRRLKKIYEKKAYEIVKYQSLKKQYLLTLTILGIISIITIIILFKFESSNVLTFIILIICPFFISDKIFKYRAKKAAKKYIEEHPNDPVNNHLKQFLY